MLLVCLQMLVYEFMPNGTLRDWISGMYFIFSIILKTFQFSKLLTSKAVHKNRRHAYGRNGIDIGLIPLLKRIIFCFLFQTTILIFGSNLG